MSAGSSKPKPSAQHSTAHERIRWSPGLAVAVTLIGLLLGPMFGGITVWLFAAVLESVTPLHLLDAWFERTEAQFLFVAVSAMFTVLVLWLAMRWKRISWRALGFGRGPRWLDLGRAAVAMAAYIGLLIVAAGLAGAFLGVDLEQEQEIGFEQARGAASLALVFVSLVVLPPLVEEVLFRGFLFTGLRTKLTFVVATIITSVLFAIPHLFASSEGLLWIAGIDTFVLSLALCYLREKTGNLWAPIFLHAIKNGAAFTFLFVIV